MADTDEQHFLRRRREELKLSQGDLALRLQARGVPFTRKTISEFERGRRLAQVEKSVLEALADALRWSLSELKNAMAASGATND